MPVRLAEGDGREANVLGNRLLDRVAGGEPRGA